MGWYKQACPQCWDSHYGMTCEEYQQRKACWTATREEQELMRKQNDLLREQNTLLKRKGA
jgi:hypothetical protein